MKIWNVFYPHMMVDVPGCSYPLADLMLRESAREFCRRTKAWTETDGFSADGEVNRFDFDFPNNAELLSVFSASVDGEPLAILSRSDLPPDWETDERAITCDALVHLSNAEFLIYPKPRQAQEVSITLVLRPSIDSQNAPDILYDEFAEAITAGAKYRLQSQSNKSWSDMSGAAINKEVFEKAVISAANKDFRQLEPAQHRVKTY